MTSLSWLIYFASVAGALVGYCIFMAVVSGLVTAVATIMSLVYTNNVHDKEECESVNRAGRLLLHWAIPIFFLASFGAIFVPDKQTVYAIAASEVGQKLVGSEAVGNIGKEVGGLSHEALETLKDWIKEQRGGEKKKKD